MPAMYDFVQKHRWYRYVHQERFYEPGLSFFAPAMPTLVLGIEFVAEFLLAATRVYLLSQHSEDASERIARLLRNDPDLALRVAAVEFLVANLVLDRVVVEGNFLAFQEMAGRQLLRLGGC